MFYVNKNEINRKCMSKIDFTKLYDEKFALPSYCPAKFLN